MSDPLLARGARPAGPIASEQVLLVIVRFLKKRAADPNDTHSAYFPAVLATDLADEIARELSAALPQAR